MVTAPARPAPALGILGGMGPFASAGFLRTVYEAAARRPGPSSEQSLPRCLLDSDPAFPDRTEAVVAHGGAAFCARLRRGVAGLLTLGATRVVVACVTAHHFLDALEPAQRERVISLVAVALDDLATAPGDDRFLLVCTNGTRAARLFERGVDRPESARMVLPGPGTQEEVHRLLYLLKQEPLTDTLADRFQQLAKENDCTGLIAGCTELHLLTRRLRARGDGPPVVDPLLTIATHLDTLLAG